MSTGDIIWGGAWVLFFAVGGIGVAFEGGRLYGGERWFKLAWAGLLIFTALVRAMNLGFDMGHFMGVRGR